LKAVKMLLFTQQFGFRRRLQLLATVQNVES